MQLASDQKARKLVLCPSQRCAAERSTAIDFELWGSSCSQRRSCWLLGSQGGQSRHCSNSLEQRNRGAKLEPGTPQFHDSVTELTSRDWPPGHQKPPTHPSPRTCLCQLFVTWPLVVGSSCANCEPPSCSSYLSDSSGEKMRPAAVLRPLLPRQHNLFSCSSAPSPFSRPSTSSFIKPIRSTLQSNKLPVRYFSASTIMPGPQV